MKKSTSRGVLPKALANQVAALSRGGRYAELERKARVLLEHYPESGTLWKTYWEALREQGKEALSALQKAAQLLPGDVGLHNNLGCALRYSGRCDEAVASFRDALAIDPEFAEAHNNLGCVLTDMGRSAEAAASCRRALELNPAYAEAYSNLSRALTAMGRHDEAITNYRRALALKPDFRAAYDNLLFCLSLDGTIGAPELFAEHCRFGEHFEAPLRAAWPVHGNTREAQRCLQVGFVSGDLRNHAVAFFLEPLLEYLGKDQQLSLHAYSNHVYEDAVSVRLQAYFKHWHRISGLSDEAVAQQVVADGIDILIDLSGHTAFNRLLCFARKPAPVQVSWMGYPGTTGLRAMDYYLTSVDQLPPGQFDDQFVEKIVQLPAAAPFLPPVDAPPVNALPALSNGYLTFGSFNRANKLSREVIALWSGLLRALPESRMVLAGLPEEGEFETLVEWFGAEGIARERLIFHVRSGMAAYLERHQQIDLCLDTYPYNGGTTTLMALWMGVPTLTRAGASVASRAGAGILGQVGLGDFVAGDGDDFVARGVRWAGDVAGLSAIRAGLRERFASSERGQPARVAEGVRRALRQMWQRWCAGLPAESFAVTLDDHTAVPKAPAKSDILASAPVYVTQPVLPPLQEFLPYLERIWESKQLTNGGPFHRQLEQALCDHLGVQHLSLFANGTLALVTALQALRIRGEVITTPYSFVATSHSLLWNGITPVFVDIDPLTLNLDPARIEAAITPQTTAILPVHCYGQPCAVDAIQSIADRYNLKVIYDAAHAFGVRDAQGSILRHGDLSALSFHATKVFNTFEGGAIVSPDARTKTHIDHLKNFGFVDEVTVVAAGINGKMSEINAAFGLLQLKGIDAALLRLRSINARYREGLSRVEGISCVGGAGETGANHAYFPILVGPGYPLDRDGLYQKLRDHNVFARRYFFPLISDFPMYRGLPSAAPTNLPVARRIAQQVICLPNYPALSNDQVDRVVDIVARS